MKLEKTMKTVLITLFIIFITIYISQASGFYEYELHKKTKLTSEQIKKFESDVKEGKKIDLENYLENTVKDYSNGFSNFGNSFSKIISKYIKECIKQTVSFIENLLT